MPRGDGPPGRSHLIPRTNAENQHSRPGRNIAYGVALDQRSGWHTHSHSSYDKWAMLLDAEGDLVGSREFFRKALAIRRVRLLYRHPQTTISAWDLFQILQRLGDAAATKVFPKHLVWLAGVDPEELQVKQQEIRDKILSELDLLDSSAAN